MKVSAPQHLIAPPPGIYTQLCPQHGPDPGPALAHVTHLRESQLPRLQYWYGQWRGRGPWGEAGGSDLVCAHVLCLSLMTSVTVCGYVCFYLFTERDALQKFTLKTRQRNY